ncbi:ABC transporter permease [Galbitalea soli]|uniref:ABC transporter permease n=1 Tax=Galbitalea soli TaxID=1268042 RepID=A0A7C9TRF1_9MICO|nr:ABC transporter permease [Galbitalea soli]NEM91440.1 ABC transporter permease [Galbitalea soli]NYJ30133.1 NitT/TauT family transport system permease protein [Galbitalea soli]
MATEALVAPAARRGRIRLRPSTWWQPVVVFFGLIGLWDLIALYYDKVQQLSFLVPYPLQVVEVVFAPKALLKPGQVAPNPSFLSQLLDALGKSTTVALTGLAIAIVIGVLWAVLMAQAKWAERSFFPYAVILQCIPILALVPLIGNLFGFEFNSRVIVTVMISLFPMVSNTLFGLQSADRAQRELFTLQGASRWTTLTKLQFPAALPSIFVGLRTAAGLSVIGAIVGDQFFQRGTPGLGVLIYVSNSRLNGPGTFAAIITASLLGVAVFLLFGLIGRLAIGKWYDFT